MSESPSRIPTRNDISINDTWDLSPLFANYQSWEEAFIEMEKGAADVAVYQGRLHEDSGTLLAAVTEMGG